MIHIYMKKSFLFILILINISFIYCQTDYYSPENIYRFAEYLYQTGDYQAAANEFQRYIFSVHDSSRVDSTLLKIGVCYQKEGDPDLSISFYQNLLKSTSTTVLRDQAHYLTAKTYLHTGDYDKSALYIDKNLSAVSSGKVNFQMQKLLGIDYLYQQQWMDARQQFSILLNSEYSDTTILRLNKFADEGERLDHKYPFMAGLLSTIIPGSGKVYAGRWEDGLFSFVSIGFYAWQCFDGFHRDGKRSTKGWVYGIMGSVFYLGNIYGSVIAARLQNERTRDEFIHKLDLEIKW